MRLHVRHVVCLVAPLSCMARSLQPFVSEDEDVVRCGIGVMRAMRVIAVRQPTGNGERFPCRGDDTRGT